MEATLDLQRAILTARKGAIFTTGKIIVTALTVEMNPERLSRGEARSTDTRMNLKGELP